VSDFQDIVVIKGTLPRAGDETTCPATPVAASSSGDGRAPTVVMPARTSVPPQDGPESATKAGSTLMTGIENESELRAQLAQLHQEHRDLDAAIEALHAAPGSDLLQVQRLKKRKLQLRDRIIRIEDQLTPDIIA